jgi:F-type H+/Na+-transporting ATPase subunit alpha
VKEFQKKLVDFLTTRKGDVLKKIAAEKKLSDSLTSELKAAADEFKETWKLSLAGTVASSGSKGNA